MSALFVGLVLVTVTCVTATTTAIAEYKTVGMKDTSWSPSKDVGAVTETLASFMCARDTQESCTAFRCGGPDSTCTLGEPNNCSLVLGRSPDDGAEGSVSYDTSVYREVWTHRVVNMYEPNVHPDVPIDSFLGSCWNDEDVEVPDVNGYIDREAWRKFVWFGSKVLACSLTSKKCASFQVGDTTYTVEPELLESHPRGDIASFIGDNTVMVAAGDDLNAGAPGGLVELYDGNGWKSVEPIPVGKVYGVLVSVSNGEMLYIGGETASVFLYDLPDDKWYSRQDVPIAFWAFPNCAFVGPFQGMTKVVICALGKFVDPDQVQAYDVEGDTWSRLDVTIAANHRDFGLTWVEGRMLFLVGGNLISNLPSEQVSILDLDTLDWIEMDTMATAVDGQSLVVVRQKMLMKI